MASQLQKPAAETGRYLGGDVPGIKEAVNEAGSRYPKIGDVRN